MIAILMGGNSAEREISLQSGEAVFAALKNSNKACFKFDWCGNNLPELWAKKFDKAFIALHGAGGEDGFIQAELEARSIKYTGSNSASSQVCMDKIASKKVWAKSGLPLANSVVAKISKATPKIDFPPPFAVKPATQGSSIGISKVETINNLAEALKLAFKYDDEVLIEQWIEGAEYTVSILQNEVLPVIKIVADAANFYDFEAKYLSEKTEYLCPSGLKKADEKTLQKLAILAFNTLGASGWGRVDFMLDAQNSPYLLEINTVPGLTSHSLLPMAAKAVGMSFEQLVAAILR